MRCRRHNLASADFVRSLHAPLPARPHHHAGRADHGRDCLKGEVATAGIADGVPTHAHPPVSFVVPAHDEARLLGATLDALHGAAIALELSHEVLVVDDASTDATAGIASDHGARVLRVEHRHIAATRNAGARATTHPILVFVDADTLIDAPVLQAALSALEGGAVGGGAGVGKARGGQRRDAPGAEVGAEFGLKVGYICQGWASIRRLRLKPRAGSESVPRHTGTADVKPVCHRFSVTGCGFNRSISPPSHKTKNTPPRR